MDNIYDNVAVVVGDANPHLAGAIKQTFGGQGLSNVVLCSTTKAFEKAIDGKMIDLIVIDHLLAGADFVELVQRIRRSLLGKNPFVTVIATMGKTEAGSTKSIMDAGADDIIPKPLTADVLFKRMTSLVHKREPFVISPNYIGPSRRTTEREEGKRPKIRDVPNTLRARMVDMAGDVEIERMVERAAAQMGDDHFEAAVVEIDRIVSRIVGFYAGVGDPEEWKRDLHRLTLCADAWRGTYDGPSKDVVKNLGGMLIALAQRIRQATSAKKVVEVELLAQLSQAVRGSVDIDHREARFFAEITQIITHYIGQSPERR